jgi:hypothetical protein
MGGDTVRIGIAVIEFTVSLLLLCLGLYFYKVKDTKTAILFLAGNYSGLDTKRICRDSGKRIMMWSVPFLVGIVIDVFNPLMSIKIAFAAFVVLVIFYIIDMSINRNKRYKL